MKIKAIVTGATGMVGEGVLHECLQHPDVEEVLIIGRRSAGISHPKVKELVHDDLHNLNSFESRLTGYNACFFCLGTTSIGKKEREYRKITHTLTLHIAGILSRLNPSMVFCYISGAGTDSTERGKLMWARIKGMTENDLTRLPFKSVYNFRPGIIQPTKGLKNTLKFYKFFGWLLYLIKKVSPRSIVSLREIGLAMINAAKSGYPKQIVEVRDIHILSRKL